MIKVSCIIPIYGVEKYIERCVESLMRQTLKDVEYIFVDDCTPDKSIEILQRVLTRFPEKENQVFIVRHKENKGLPAARNTGMTKARGEYIYHCDSDDFVEDSILEDMYSTAMKTEADFVWCDWALSYENKERAMKMPSYATADEALKSMLGGGMKYNVWNKLVRRSVYLEHGIEFPSGHAMGEDMTMIRLMACAKNVAYVPKTLYHYVRTNGEAMTQSFSEGKIKDMLYNVDSTIQFVSSIKQENIAQWLAFFKLQTKFPFLITDKKDTFDYWKRLFPEANAFIGRNPFESRRAVLLQYLACNNQFWIISLYYKIVYKFVYRLIYS